MSFSQIGTALYNKMVEMKTASQPVGEVYNYEIKTTDIYPYISITPIELIEEVLDQLQNSATYNFTIRVIDKNDSIQTMEARMRTIVDLVLGKLRDLGHNITISDGTSVRLTWTGNWGWLDEQEPIRVFNINFSGLILKDI